MTADDLGLASRQPTPSQQPKMSLDEFFTDLIAQHEQLSPSEVTLDYIRHQREARIYPNIRSIFGSKLGGYQSYGLRFPSRDELQDLAASVDAAVVATKSIKSH